MKRIPQPVSDPDNPLHYNKSGDVTPTQYPINGKPREPDNFQPRTNIRKQWDDGQLPIKEEIQSFCQEFGVEPELVKLYILHLQDLRTQADIRERGREEQKKQQRKAKSVHDYDWHQLVDSEHLYRTGSCNLNQTCLFFP